MSSIDVSTSLPYQLFKYLIAGGTAAGLWTIIIIALVEYSTAHPALASGIGFCVASIFNYIMQYFWTFKAVGTHRVMATRYAAVTLVMLVVNIAIFWCLYETLGAPYLYAHLVATGIVVMLNFTVNRLYTFA